MRLGGSSSSSDVVYSLRDTAVRKRIAARAGPEVGKRRPSTTGRRLKVGRVYEGASERARMSAASIGERHVGRTEGNQRPPRIAPSEAISVGRPLCEGPSVFTTTPPSNGADPDTYRNHVVETALWSEMAGCEGTLVYTDNGLVDPWLVSQTIIACTERLCPLIALQPVYMHPYAAAKLVASF